MPEHNSPEDAWRSPEERDGATQIRLTPEQLCAIARSRERLNARVTGAIVAMIVAVSGLLLFNVYRVDRPWIRLGQAWTLGVLGYLFAAAFDHRSCCRGAGEPCALFLARQHEERRSGYLRFRQRLFLFLPGIAASWWGGGPPGFPGALPFLLVLTALFLVWLAFGKAAEKAAHDREEVLRIAGE